jgi:hypothetical protein
VLALAERLSAPMVLTLTPRLTAKTDRAHLDATRKDYESWA